MSTRAFGRLLRPAGLAALSLAVAGALGLWRPSLQNLSLSLDDGARLEIGHARWNGSWLGTAFAQTADTVLENVTVELGAVTYRLPRIEFSGVSLSRPELMALFEGGSGEPLAPRLARLSAREVRIPEVRIEQKVPTAGQITVYRDVIARDLTGGRIASLTSAGSTFEMTGTRPAKGGSGPMTIGDFDLALAATLHGQRAGSDAAEARTVAELMSVDDLRISGSRGADLRIARLSGKDFRARPTEKSWREVTRIVSDTQDLEKASPDERARLFSTLADLFDAFAVGSIEATGVDIRDSSAKDQPTIRMARLAYKGESPGQAADARVEGLEIVSAKGRARGAALAFAGFSFQDTLLGLRRLGEKPLETLDTASLRSLVPTIGTTRLSGLHFDVANETSKSRENIRFAVRAVEVTADKPVNGIPANLRFTVDNVTFAIPENPTEQGLKDLTALGYGNLDLSFATAVSWNEPGSEFVVREVSVRGSEMGSATLRGALANVGRDVFNPDSAVALVALVGATARNLEVTLENKGLFERIMAQAAVKQRKSPEDLRREYGMAAAIAVPTMLGNSASARAVGQAVARFVAKPGRLHVSARTKDPAGLGIADFVGANEPAALLDKLEVTATAE